MYIEKNNAQKNWTWNWNWTCKQDVSMDFSQIACLERYWRWRLSINELHWMKTQYQYLIDLSNYLWLLWSINGLNEEKTKRWTQPLMKTQYINEDSINIDFVFLHRGIISLYVFLNTFLILILFGISRFKCICLRDCP